ncbi:hypothetical protein ACF1A9_10885 [Streptomyces sp. NPDC014872]|uniref:hypothetical protein n=1 Tax=Streptomyces sp. NPDC014872 TaxID=3364926 RepID=UPI0036FA24A3
MFTEMPMYFAAFWTFRKAASTAGFGWLLIVSLWVSATEAADVPCSRPSAGEVERITADEQHQNPENQRFGAAVPIVIAQSPAMLSALDNTSNGVASM